MKLSRFHLEGKATRERPFSSRGSDRDSKDKTKPSPILFTPLLNNIQPEVQSKSEEEADHTGTGLGSKKADVPNQHCWLN